MRQILFSVTLILLNFSAFSQCYQIFEQSYNPFPYTGGTSYELGDDTFSDTVDIGFPFCFFGETVSKCLISPNGYITFHLDSANKLSNSHVNSSIPVTNPNYNLQAVNFSVLGPWQDLYPQTSGTITSEIYGVYPYRKFVVSYDSVLVFGCWGEPISQPQVHFSGQIVLFESLNVVDINIRNREICSGSPFADFAIEGILNQFGTEAYTVQGRNFPENWTVQNDCHRFIPTCDCPVDSAGNFNLVPGKVFWDENSNCSLDSNEVNLPHVRIDIQPGNGSVWTNQNGEFGVILEPGNYTFEHSLQNPWYLINECQPNGIPVTVVEDSNAVDVCFADSIIPVVDLSATIASNAINACFNNSQYVSVCNEGTILVSNVEVNVQIPSFTGTSNPLFTSTSDSTWSLSIPVLQAGECRNYAFSGTAACDSSMIGQVACLSVDITSSETDIEPSNNSMSFCDEVGVSYDPNDIRVLSQNQTEGWRTQEFIDDDDELTYMVRFQNTGTGPAFNVIVHNPLSDDLNHQSIELIAASHDYYAQMIDGELRLNFLGIELPDSASDPIGSQGFFMYKVNQAQGNLMGTVIENQVDIFFDFNAPIATNITENEIQMITGNSEVKLGDVNIFPNPTSNEVFISNSNSRNTIIYVEVLDLQGRLLHSENRTGISQIDLSALRQGIYLIRIETAKGTVVNRVIKN